MNLRNVSSTQFVSNLDDFDDLNVVDVDDDVVDDDDDDDDYDDYDGDDDYDGGGGGGSGRRGRDHDSCLSVYYYLPERFSHKSFRWTSRAAGVQQCTKILTRKVSLRALKV